MEEYSWIGPEKLNAIDWSSDEVGQDGYVYILSVSLRYPHSIHSETSDLPLCPSKRFVKSSELSQRQKDSLKRLGLTNNSYLSTAKLILDCHDNPCYTIYYENLRIFLHLGMQLVTVHKRFHFRETECFKTFIERNLELRKLASSRSESAFVKWVSNSVFGRSLMQKKDLFEVKFAGCRETILKSVRSSRLRDVMILNSDLSMLFFHPKKVLHDDPIQCEFVCLERANMNYYFGWYQQLLPAFRYRAKICCKDTGMVSLCTFFKL